MLQFAQLKSLSSYGLKGSVRTKGEGMELITLVNVESCGLTAPDGFKGAASTANVAVYKLLEKPCSRARRTHVPTQYEALPPQKLVQQSTYTSHGFNNSAWKLVANHHIGPGDQRALSNMAKIQEIGTDKVLTTVTENFGVSSARSDDASLGAVLQRRQQVAQNDLAKTHEDVILTADMDEIKYTDPLGPGNGYPDFQHRYNMQCLIGVYAHTFYVCCREATACVGKKIWAVPRCLEIKMECICIRLHNCHGASGGGSSGLLAMLSRA
jgi:hypothetical protein